MDKNTMKKITKPLFSKPSYFNPDLVITEFDLNYMLHNPCKIFIDRYYNFKAKEYVQEIYACCRNQEISIIQDENYKGFKIDEKGNLIEKSSIYVYVVPIKIKGEYYGICKKMDETVGICNQEGIPLEGFGFNYKLIKENEYAKDSINNWFYVEDNQNNSGFINLKGEKKLFNEKITYPFYYILFSYGVDSNGLGVVDLSNMTIAIKPNSKYKIEDLIYICDEEIDATKIENRDKADIYFIVNDGKTEFLIDMNLKEYKVVN